MLPPLLLTFHPLHTYLIPICFVTAWIVCLMLVANLWTLSQDTVIYAQRMHQIPCSKCRFFTENYQLKCTVHPTDALTETAIGCPDYQPDQYIFDFHSTTFCTITKQNSKPFEHSHL